MATEPYILIVDDDPQNVFLLEELLSLEGYRTSAAMSGSAAIATAESNPPQLILLDVMMPGMDGFEVCGVIRTHPQLQAIPIIFLTALSDEDSRLRGLSAMGDDYLTKPINPGLMLTKVDSLLRLYRLRAQRMEAAFSHQIQGLMERQERTKHQMMATWKINEALAEKFRLFVPEQMLRRIAPEGVDSIRLGNATESELTIMFCDIRDFTGLVESQQAIATFQWLNAFFTRLNGAITDHNGFIDKFLGDAVMAVFDQEETHAADAVEAALAMEHTVAEFNQERRQFELEQPIRIGIGIHSGTGVIGTLGATERMESTVVGDVVNTAARLEDLTKTYRCPIVASGAVVQRLTEDPRYQLQWLDQMSPRGKQQRLDLYCIKAKASEPA